jgi:hypothetical protein
MDMPKIEKQIKKVVHFACDVIIANDRVTVVTSKPAGLNMCDSSALSMYHAAINAILPIGVLWVGVNAGRVVYFATLK